VNVEHRDIGRAASTTAATTTTTATATTTTATRSLVVDPGER
jgi:hypothetical protein